LITIHTGNNVVAMYDHLLRHGEADKNRQMYYKSNECIQEYIKSRKCFWMPEAFMTLDQIKYFVSELVSFVEEDITVYTNSDIFMTQLNIVLMKNQKLKDMIKVYLYHSDKEAELLEQGVYGYTISHMNELLKELLIETAEAQDLVVEI